MKQVNLVILVIIATIWIGVVLASCYFLLNIDSVELEIFWAVIIPINVMFLFLTILFSILHIKTFRINSEGDEKEKEYERRVHLERMRTTKINDYKQNQKEKKEEQDDFAEKVKKIYQDILEEKKDVYQINLDRLKSDISLFNEIKDVIERDSNEIKE